MTPRGFALFDTTVGTCAAAWSDRGLVGVQLPESSAADTRAPVDLSALPVDMDDVPAFDRRVYEVARTIPHGSAVSYGTIAAASVNRTRESGRRAPPVQWVIPYTRALTPNA